MDALRDEVEQLERSDNLKASIDDIQKAIDHLKTARRKVEADPQAAPITLAKLQTPVKQALDAAHDDLKKINHRLNKYSKALDKPEIQR
jgi:DNA repair ATPase RecN